MAKLLKLRRGTTSQHSSFTGAEGEVTVDTDKEALVVHNGSTAGGFPVARADGTGVANFTITGELDAATLDISGNADIDGTLEADAYTVDGTALNEYIADTVGGMVTGNTETGIAVTYEDGDNTLDFVVGTLNQNTTGTAANLSGTPDITVGVVTAGSLDISGNADIDGTLEADAYTVNGTALDTHIAGVTVTNSTNAAHVSVADNENTNENNLIPFIEDASATGNVGLESDGDFHYNPSSGQLTVPAVSTSGNVTVAGNLTVNGTTTTVATTNTTVTDNLIELNSGASSNANDSGILIERGSTGDNAIIAWDESADKFALGTTTSTNTATGDITITTGTVVANVEGNVTGNVTGNTSGSSGSCTGNAATATQLATARTIGGTSFNGTANITPAEATNADTVDSLHAASFIRSDANDTATGQLNLTYSSAYPLNINNGNNGKLVLQGSSDPYMYFREGTTDKCYLQWTTNGVFTIYNSEQNKGLALGSTLTWDGGTVWTSANDGAGSGLAADTLDGVSSGSLLRSDTADTATGDISFQGGAGAVSIDNNSDIRFSNGNWTGDDYGKIQHHSNYLYVCGGTSGIVFREAAVNRWFIDDNGHFVPGSDSSYNIGSSGTRVTHGYFDNLSDSKGDVRKIPNNHTTSAYTLVAADSGKVVTNTSGGVNVPYNVFAVGDTITIINQSGSDITITQGSSNTMYNTADASTGNRTLAGRGMATVWYKAHNECYISGAGLS